MDVREVGRALVLVLIKTCPNSLHSGDDVHSVNVYGYILQQTASSAAGLMLNDTYKHKRKMIIDPRETTTRCDATSNNRKQNTISPKHHSDFRPGRQKLKMWPSPPWVLTMIQSFQAL